MSPLLDTASRVYAGAVEASRVYAGSALIYQKASAPAGVNLFSGTISNPDQAVDATGYVFGTEFWVNKAGCYVTKVRYFHPTVGTLTPRTMALYSTTNGTASTKVGGDWTMPTPTAGAWCSYTLPTPIALTANLHYRIACLHPTNTGFARDYNWFWSGGAEPGAAQTTIGGFLVRPGSAQAYNTCQGSYIASATMAFPNQVYNYAAYYIDVEVTDVAP